MEQEKRQRLRVLCLHGYRQNAQIFQKKTGALRKAFKSQLEFEFVSAPLVPTVLPQNAGDVDEEANCQSVADSPEEQPRAWWFSNREWRTFSSKETTEIADGFEESMECVLNFAREKGPFDGMLGFSQGASLVHLLLASKFPELHVQFVILFSGFRSLSDVHRPLMDIRITTPSFHVYGLSDEIVHHNRSEELAQIFDNAQSVAHSGKHCIPPVKEFRDQLNVFLDALF